MKRISLGYIISMVLLSMVGFGSLYSQILPPITLSARPVEENKILLEWESPTDYEASRFTIYRSIHDTVSFVYLGFVLGDKNTYLDNNLQIGVNYTYFVVALKASGGDTTFSESKFVTTQAISGVGKVQINSAPRTYAEVDKVYSEQVIAVSSDRNATLRYSLISAPREMTIDSTTGLITWRPDRNGRFDIMINVKNTNDINHIELGSPIPQTTYKFNLQVASKTSSLYGSVKSMINSPISGLTVKIFQVNNDEFTYETITNSEGNFYFNGISAGDYYVYVKGLLDFESKWYPDAKDFSTANTITCVEGGTLDINFVLNQEIKEQYRISGTVKDTNGISINNATVLFYDASRFINIGLENANIEDIIEQKNVNYINGGQTNSKGEYSVPLPRGKYYFAICQADGFSYMFYSNQTSLLYASKIYLNNDRNGVDFAMIPSKKTSNQLKGKVLSEDTNEGIESRIILIKKQNEERGGSGIKVPFRGVPSETYITFKTDVFGNFEIENLDTTKYWIQAIPLNAYLPVYYHPENSTTFNWYDADSIYTFGIISNIKIYSAPIINDGVGIITGKVTTTVADETLRGIIVYAELNGNIVAYAVTDSLGDYLIKGLRSGTYKLSADFLGYTKVLQEINVTLNYSNSFIVRNANMILAYEPTTIVVPNPFVPTEYYISQNYPNPFNPSTIIEYKLERESFVELKIYDILGREVEKLVSSTQSAGTYKVVFSAKNIASGVYFASMKVQNGNKVVYLKQIKMLLTK